MARQRRLNEPGTYHHITARGVDRCRIFLDDGDRRQFLALLGESHQRFGCRVLAFCLMDNHIHLTLLDDHGKLSKTLHFLNGVYAKKFNLRHDRTGHLFERRFWSSMLGSDAYLTTCVKYVHRNPVEAGLLERPEDHRWSSYSSYLGLRRPPDFLDTQVVLAHYGNDPSELRRHTAEELPDQLVTEQLRRLNPPERLGVSDRPTIEPPPSQKTRRRASVADLVATTAEVTGLTVDAIEQPTPGRKNQARGLVAYAGHRHLGITLQEIAERLGMSSNAAASLASRRFAESLDPGSEQLVARVLSTLHSLDRTC